MIKHISTSNVSGKIVFLKSSLADIIELIRLSPNTARVLLCIAYNSNSHNELISDVDTISNILNMKKDDVIKSLKELHKNAYIEITRVTINSDEDIELFFKNQSYYRNNSENIWHFVDNELVNKYSENNEYNKFIVNCGIIKCSNNKDINIVLNDYNKHLYSKENR